MRIISARSPAATGRRTDLPALLSSVFASMLLSRVTLPSVFRLVPGPYRDHSTLESDPASWLGQDSRGTCRYRKARHFGDDFMFRRRGSAGRDLRQIAR